MKKIVILVLNLVLLPCAAHAQNAAPMGRMAEPDLTAADPEPEASSEPQSMPQAAPPSPRAGATKDDFDYIKAEISRLLIENKKLESEYEALKHQVESLKIRALEKEREAETRSAQNEEWSKDRSHQKEMNALKAVYGGAEKLRNEIMVKKSRTGYLSTELVNLEEKQRPWKLRRSDLEYMKRELELDIQLINYELEAREQRRQDAASKVQELIQGNLMMERELLAIIDDVERGTLYDPQNLLSLLEENEAMALKVMNLAHDTEFQARENDILDKKRILLGHSKGDILDQKRQEKDALLDEVQHLEQHVNKLDLSLERSLQEKSRREEILKDFVFLQQENDKLRSQISHIHSRLNGSP